MSRRVIRGFNPETLTRIRTQLGYSRADLARHAGVGTATVQQWESGNRSPQVDKLALVAAALNVSMGELVEIPKGERFPSDWRVLLGLTQPQLGQQTGITTSTIARIERGEVALSDVNAATLSKALGISADVLRASYERARTRPPGTLV